MRLQPNSIGRRLDLNGERSGPLAQRIRYSGGRLATRRSNYPPIRSRSAAPRSAPRLARVEARVEAREKRTEGCRGGDSKPRTEPDGCVSHRRAHSAGFLLRNGSSARKRVARHSLARVEALNGLAVTQPTCDLSLACLGSKRLEGKRESVIGASDHSFNEASTVS